MVNSIVCDNCFGVAAYKDCPEPYTSPFINIASWDNTVEFFEAIQHVDFTNIREVKDSREYMKGLKGEVLEVPEDWIENGIPVIDIDGFKIMLPHCWTYWDYLEMYSRRMRRFNKDRVVLKIGLENLERNGIEVTDFNVINLAKTLLSKSCIKVVITYTDLVPGLLGKLMMKLDLDEISEGWLCNDKIMFRAKYDFEDDAPSVIPKSVKKWLWYNQ